MELQLEPLHIISKTKEKDPQLEEDFADFHDNIKETASSAANVASRLKEKVEQTVEERSEVRDIRMISSMI